MNVAWIARGALVMLAIASAMVYLACAWSVLPCCDGPGSMAIAGGADDFHARLKERPYGTSTSAPDGMARRARMDTQCRPVIAQTLSVVEMRALLRAPPSLA